IKEGGETKKMAKRFGTFVTADQVLDEVPRDVFTYFMLSKGSETHLDFDLQLAKDTSEKNPIYYLQYAHARIQSLLQVAEERGVKADERVSGSMTDYEKRLLYMIDRYGQVITEAAETFRTHLIPNYLHTLATRFHYLYAHQRILTDNPDETAKGLLLARKTGEVLKDGLALLNIVAMEKM
ncbi:arginine--tRNA ligase, partial [Patescibacteria group bacterium]|nr:arginine--tRNA ligase [Patescibacteria group bacterium]